MIRPNIRIISSRLRENKFARYHADFKEDRSSCESHRPGRASP
jgi:hypothetical protein